jgi:hypothetical protein
VRGKILVSADLAMGAFLPDSLSMLALLPGSGREKTCRCEVAVHLLGSVEKEAGRE